MRGFDCILYLIGWVGTVAAAEPLPPPADFISALKGSRKHEFMLRGLLLDEDKKREVPLDCADINRLVLQIAERSGWPHQMANEELPCEEGVGRLVITFQATRLWGNYNLQGSVETGAEINWKLKWNVDRQEWNAAGSGLDPVKSSVSQYEVAPPEGYWHVALGLSDLWPLLAKTLIQVRGIEAAMDGLVLAAPVQYGGLFHKTQANNQYFEGLGPDTFPTRWRHVTSRPTEMLAERLLHPSDGDRILAAWHLLQFNWSAPVGGPEEVILMCARDGGDRRHVFHDVASRFGQRAVEPLGVVLKTASNERRREDAAEELIAINSSASWREVREAAKANIPEAHAILQKHRFDGMTSPPFLISLGVIAVGGYLALMAQKWGWFKRESTTRTRKASTAGKRSSSR